MTENRSSRNTGAAIKPDSPAVDRALASAGYQDEAFRGHTFRRLVARLLELRRVVVAYSGGVDSTFLLKVASDLLGAGCMGVIGVSESLDRNEFESAQKVAERLGVRLHRIETHEYESEAYRRNDENRCFHCKDELFQRARRFAATHAIEHVLDGSNADDQGDYRPGMRARDMHRVLSPLIEAGLGKDAVRHYSRLLDLPTWDKPAAPCLSSRIPYGNEVTATKLRQVESGEAELRRLGFRVVRLRHHGEVARIEVPLSELERLLSQRQEVVAVLRSIGFDFVALDLEGFRSGSLNRSLDVAEGAGAAAEARWVPLESVGRLTSDSDDEARLRR